MADIDPNKIRTSYDDNRVKERFGVDFDDYKRDFYRLFGNARQGRKEPTLLSIVNQLVNGYEARTSPRK